MLTSQDLMNLYILKLEEEANYFKSSSPEEEICSCKNCQVCISFLKYLKCLQLNDVFRVSTKKPRWTFSRWTTTARTWKRKIILEWNESAGCKRRDCWQMTIHTLVCPFMLYGFTVSHSGMPKCARGKTHFHIPSYVDILFLRWGYGEYHFACTLLSALIFRELHIKSASAIKTYLSYSYLLAFKLLFAQNSIGIASRVYDTLTHKPTEPSLW